MSHLGLSRMVWDNSSQLLHSRPGDTFEDNMQIVQEWALQRKQVYTIPAISAAYTRYVSGCPPTGASE
jgi:hypothetical protein